MTHQHRAVGCLWAVPTLSLAYPAWLDAEDKPWSCVRTGTPEALETTEGCPGCPHWESRDEAEVTPARSSSASA